MNHPVAHSEHYLFPDYYHYYLVSGKLYIGPGLVKCFLNPLERGMACFEPDLESGLEELEAHGMVGEAEMVDGVVYRRCIAVELERRRVGRIEIRMMAEVVVMAVVEACRHCTGGVNERRQTWPRMGLFRRMRYTY